MSDLDAEFARILDGAAGHEEMLDFLERSVAWMRDPAALVAGARALRERMLRVNAPEGAIDVCGTGGDGAHTLNISTAVAFVVAGAGVPVAKHGNRAMSSKSGAADVLEALGVKLSGDRATLERALREANIAFLFAQNHHPALARVAAARRAFGRRTIFNLLGPLANPAGVRRQLLGVFAPDYMEPMAQALRELGCERAWVVHGAGGLDELSCEGANQVAEVSSAGIRLFQACADDAELSSAPNSGLRGGDATENARRLKALLEGMEDSSEYFEVVMLNAAAALAASGQARNLEQGSLVALESMKLGYALEALEKLIAVTQDEAAP